MVVAGCQENESCSKVLNFLERLDDRIRYTEGKTGLESLLSGHNTRDQKTFSLKLETEN